MALSYLTESEAPRDFRVSSTESDGHYKKCLLCYTVKRNFYCPECIRAGNFVHSSMPYSDRFAEKQAKLLRLKANRRHVLDRCEKLLSPKIKRDTLLTESKQSRDKIDLLRLAIEQRRNNIDEKKKALADLVQHNNDLKLKLPRYQKRVASLGKHAESQRIELQNKITTYNDQAEALAALRRSRIRQLTKYIFPVYMTYDSSDSIEDMEFIGGDTEEWPRRTPQLHIGAPWINADGDLSHLQDLVSQSKEATTAEAAAGAGAGAEAGAGADALTRSAAALGLAAQLAALLAAVLRAPTPHPLSLSEYCNWRAWEGGCARARRLCACAVSLAARAGLPPPAAGAPLAALADLCSAAAADHPALGRVEAWMDGELADQWRRWAERAPPAPPAADGDDAEPEHLVWPDTMPLEQAGRTPPSPAPSLVTSAAASIASIWRGWTK